MLDYEIAGTSLNDKASGLQLVASTSYANAVNMRRTNVVIPGMHGELPQWDDPIGAATLVLSMKITATTDLLLTQRWNAFLRLLGIGAQRPVGIDRITSDGRSTTQAQLVTTTTPEYYCSGSHMLKTLVTMHIPSGRWTDTDYTEQTVPLSTGVDVGFVSDSTAAVTDLFVRVAGPVSSMTIDDTTTGTGIQVAAGTSVPSGQYLLLDCAAFRLWQNTTSSWTEQGTDLTGRLATRGNGMLAPAPGFTGTSSLDITAAGSGGTPVVVMRGRRTTV